MGDQSVQELQVWGHFRGVELESPEFQTQGLYAYVRHSLYLGFLTAFWATPDMTVGHLVFSAVWSGWILGRSGWRRGTW